MKIDLNSDLGEGAGHDHEILPLVSSANISCGFHAGTPASILASITGAAQHGVSIGAHPSFDDRENFGRSERPVAPADIFALVIYQLGAFRALCSGAGVRMKHVKAHGALYNASARDPEIADAIGQAVSEFDPELILFAQAGGVLEQAARDFGLQTASEVFADRNYNADGSLVSRTQPEALLHNPDEAAERVVRMLRHGRVRAIDGSDIPISAGTVCVHGDTPGAAEFVRTLRGRLEREGIMIAAPPSCRPKS